MSCSSWSVAQSAWWLSFFPGLAIVITTVSATILASWVRIATDPDQRWRLTVPRSSRRKVAREAKRALENKEVSA